MMTRHQQRLSEADRKAAEDVHDATSKNNEDNEVVIAEPPVHAIVNAEFDRDIDSVSQVSSVTSSVVRKSRRVDLIRSRAELKASLALTSEREAIEVEELKIQQRRKLFELKSKLAALDEEEKLQVDDDPVDPVLNPKAREFVPSTLPPRDDFEHMQAAQSVQVNNSNVPEPSMIELINAVRLPSAQLVMFDGDPLNYNTFMKSFENSVESCTSDDASKLMRLITYCTGKARKTIECCAALSPSEGYVRAKQLLKRRFGNSYLIAETWINRLTGEKPIRPNEGERLLNLADDLTSFIETLKAVNYESELYNQHDILKIAELLPTYLQARVKRELCKLRDEGIIPEFTHLAQLIREAAREANDPVFGKLAARVDNVQFVKPPVNRQSMSAVTSVHSQSNSGYISKACPKCGESHSIFHCESFKSLSVNERTEFVRQKRLCFNCLSQNHIAANCSSTRRCTVNGCGKPHTKFLHKVDSFQRNNNAADTPSTAAPAITGDTAVATKLKGAGTCKNVLPIVHVIVRKPGCNVEVKTYALLDGGSTHTFVCSAIARQLHLCETNHTISLATLTDTVVQSSKVVDLEVCNMDRTVVVEINEVIESPVINIDLSNRATIDEVRAWPHLNDIKLPEIEASEVGILIGQDCPDAIMPLQIRRGERGAPFAIRTAFGWTINGPVVTSIVKQRSVSTNFVSSNQEVENQVQRLWMMDMVPEPQNLSLSRDDVKVLSLWNDTIHYVDGHYEMAIPFKCQPPDLPDNYVVARQRLDSLKRRLSRNPELHEKYTVFMQNLIEKHYAERVVTEGKVGEVWYLPHHSVHNPNKPDKVRVVFDCSVKYDAVSLNEKVHQGPDLMNKLVDVLLRFRMGPIAFIADVEAMFHQVHVSVEDRDCLRFLWWPNGNLNVVPEIYRMTVHLFGGIWSPSCCNYALKRTAEDRRAVYDEEVVDTVLKNFYVDDCLKSVESEDLAVQLVHGLRSMLKEGGFNLTKWISNSSAVLSAVPTSERSVKSSVNFQHDDDTVDRALGVRWETSSDTIGFTTVIKNKPMTRRGILSIINSVYDPLGLVSPFVLPAKRIMQELSKLKLGWDDQLPENEFKAWEHWTQDQKRLGMLKINRCVRLNESLDTVQVHHFCDASQFAYGTAAYVVAREAVVC